MPPAASRRTRVLIVDDSALMRQVLSDLLSRDPELEVVGTAPDPIAAWDRIQKLQPDVVTLDVEMPKMDGLTFLEKLMRLRPTRVVMVSSLTERGCDVTLRALELGAIDYVSKPKIDVQTGTLALAPELLFKVKGAARARLPAAGRPAPSPAPMAASGSIQASTAAAAGLSAGPSASMQSATSGSSPGSSSFRTTHQVIAIGASTGGTEALKEVLCALPADSPGIVMVLHMPEKFTTTYAARLDSLCRIRVREAKDGDRVLPGQALLAPGDRHMVVKRTGALCTVQLSGAPPVQHHRPSVDVLFDSCAKALGQNVVGVILTGMGADGARGLLAMREAGARTVAQDERSCVVFGMPREAILLGAVEEVLPLNRIAPTMLRMAQRG